MEPFGIFLTAGGALLTSMTLLWLLSLVRRDAGIVDVFWGPGFVVANLVYLSLADHSLTPRSILVTMLVVVWGFRLAIHIFFTEQGQSGGLPLRRLEAGTR